MLFGLGVSTAHRQGLWFFLAAGLVLTACYGTTDVDLKAAGHDVPPPGSAPVGSGPGSEGIDRWGSPEVDCSAPRDVGTKVMHRLNRLEYNNTVADLLGDTTRPANDFPADGIALLFDNNADTLGLSSVLFERYEAAAEKLAANALASASPVRAKILSCSPASIGADACQKQILEAFARRAWRRPVTSDEVARLQAVANVAVGQGDSFEAGIQLALKAALLSPHFLYRVELDPDPASTAPHPLADFELASRLSYFLWSSMPDDALFAAAAAGGLNERAELESQVQRMLADPKAKNLVDAFYGRWLGLAAVDEFVADAAIFPSFDAALKAAMVQETKLVFDDFMKNGRAFTDMMDADFTFVNGRLASHYGIQGVSGAGFQKVQARSNHRGGLLTMASVLTLTSLPSRTSPVRRGAFVLGAMMCSEPPPAPPDVPTLPEPSTGETLRERMEAHRSNPQCAGCHAAMDPIGFGMENFDAVGAHRTTENGTPIDSSGKLPDGSSFNGAIELAGVLKQNPRMEACVSQHLYSYALGRVATQADVTTLDCALRAPNADKSWPGLILTIATSEPFRMRRPSGGQP